MQRNSFVALAVAGVVLPAFAIVSVAGLLGVFISQEVALAGALTLGIVALGGSPGAAIRR